MGNMSGICEEPLSTTPLKVLVKDIETRQSGVSPRLILSWVGRIAAPLLDLRLIVPDHNAQPQSVLVNYFCSKEGASRSRCARAAISSSHQGRSIVSPLALMRLPLDKLRQYSASHLSRHKIFYV
jgi:hypothetical protein